MQAWFADRRDEESILGASPVAGEAHVAVAAVSRKGVELGVTESPPLGRLQQFENRAALRDVPQQVVGLDVAVAGVEITVVFQRQCIATGTRVDAETDVIHSKPVREGGNWR